MTLIQLQYFQAVCKFENFTRAAEALHISQPAMSAAMKDMEREFDKVYGHWPMVRSCQYLCVGKDSPLANESFVTLEQIAGEPMVMLKDNFSQSRGIRKQFRDRGLECNVIHYTNQMYTVERFVEQNIAVGFLPRDVAEGNPKIVGIPYEGTREKVIELFWRKVRFLFSATKNFIRTAKEEFPEV